VGPPAKTLGLQTIISRSHRENIYKKSRQWRWKGRQITHNVGTDLQKEEGKNASRWPGGGETKDKSREEQVVELEVQWARISGTERKTVRAKLPWRVPTAPEKKIA